MVGIGFYLGDYGTDLKFAFDMYDMSTKNFSQEMGECRMRINWLNEKYSEMNCFEREELVENFKCLDFLSKLKQDAGRCFKRERHFDDQKQFAYTRNMKNILKGFDSFFYEMKYLHTSYSLELFLCCSFFSYISFFHCFLSLAFGFLIFLIHFRQEKRKIPITIFSRTFYFMERMKILILMKTPLHLRDEEFELKKEKIQSRIEWHQKNDWGVFKFSMEILHYSST